MIKIKTIAIAATLAFSTAALTGCPVYVDNHHRGYRHRHCRKVMKKERVCRDKHHHRRCYTRRRTHWVCSD